MKILLPLAFAAMTLGACSTSYDPTACTAPNCVSAPVAPVLK